MIAAKYAEPRIAHRNLETLLAATLEATLLDVEGLGDAAGPAYEVLDELAARAQRAYAELVHETPGFVEYFKASTPVSEIGALNIGSRPTSRKPTTSISDLRAIPWVLAWSQSRVMLPGWYGTGTAFEEWIAEGRRPAGGAAGPVPAVAVLPRPCCRTWRRCWPSRTWDWPRATPNWSRTRRCGAGCSTRSSTSTTAPSGCTSSSPARTTCWPTTRRWPARCSTGSRTWSR